MASLSSDVRTVLTPLINNIKAVNESGEVTERDRRVLKLSEKILSVMNHDGAVSIKGVHFRNTHLSDILTLADLKVSIETSDKLTKWIVDYLGLGNSLEKFYRDFHVVERVRQVSDEVLNHVSLFQLQTAGFLDELKDTPVWYALAPEELLLSRQVRELSNYTKCSGVIAARIREIEETEPGSLDGFQNVKFKAPWMFRNLNLTIGKMRGLSCNELNGTAKKIPTSACALLSDEQIRGLNFAFFSGPQLDKMIYSDGTKSAIEARLGLLNREQLVHFLKKSTGVHFDKFSDRFFGRFLLSALTKEEVGKFFKCVSREEIARAKYHLALVPKEEIARGLHLLSDKHLALLPSEYIAELDYSLMTQEIISDLFLSRHLTRDQKFERANLIPDQALNGVVRQVGDLVHYLSNAKLRKLDPEVIDTSTIHSLFPGITIETLYPGHEHSSEEIAGKMVYAFTRRIGRGYASTKGVSQAEIENSIGTNRKICFYSAKRFNKEQLKVLIPKMHPEVQQIIRQNIEALSQKKVHFAADV